MTNEGRRLLAGEITPTLSRPAKRLALFAAVDADSWEGVDRDLFDALRQLRARSQPRTVPAYIVFGDATLRDMARHRPSTVERFLDVRGVGQQKAVDFGELFVNRIVTYCREHELEMDVRPEVLSL